MKWLCTLSIVSAINVFLAKVFLPLHIKYQSSDEEIMKMEIEVMHSQTCSDSKSFKISFLGVDIFTHLSFGLF